MSSFPLLPSVLQADDVLFFIHLPKTAGTSMRAILDMHFDAPTICPINRIEDFAHFPPEKVKEYRLIRGHLPYTLSQYFDRRAVLITMLRHPVELTISYYRFIQRAADHPFQTDALRMPLVEFVAAHRHVIVEQTTYLSANFDTALHPLPNEREALAVAKDRLDTMPFVGVAENFEQALQLLFYTLAWRPLKIIPALNRAPTTTNRDQYSPAEISAIEELTAVDIELYQHGLLLFKMRYQQMLQALLENHYEWQNPAWHNPQTQLEISMAQAFEGENWHDLEYLHQKWAYRWTGPAKVASLDVGLVASQSYHIEIHVLFAISDYILNTWHLRVHELVIPLQRTAHPETGDIFRGIIPAEALRHGRRFTRLEIIVMDTLRPSDIPPGSADERDLGMAIASFRLYPIFA